MAFFPRYGNTFGADFAPLFRLLDEGISDFHRQNPQAGRHSSVRAFSPRFDVKEHDNEYTLEGELPGIEQKNVEIEFTDPHTIVIKGRTEHEYTSGTPAIEGQEQGRIEGAEGKAPHKATVEDEDAQTSTDVAKTGDQSKEVSNEQAPQWKTWISERSVGEFHRSFSFPTRVDQEAVKASLKNGILSIVVPKAKAPESRKIAISE